MSDYIPPELVPNILARLPIDTLLRCTIVCKSWYSLITSSSFISSHLNLSTPNQESRLMIRYITNLKDENNISRIDRDNYCVLNQTFEEISELVCPITTGIYMFTMIATFNGLFCLSDSRIERIILWNPSIRKTLCLPKPGVISHTPGCHRHSVGFCFLPTTNDYKIVRVSYLDSPEGEKLPPEVEIYELSVGSWRNLSDVDFEYVILNYSPQAFLKGTVHWLAKNPDRVGHSFSRLIGTFDMKSEKFGALMLPSCLRDDWRFSVSTFRESLYLMHSPDKYCSVWVMKEYGVADSWEKQFKIGLGEHILSRPLYFRENGDILFLKKIGNPVVDSYTFVSYDPEKHEMKNVGLSKNAFLFHVESYVESLVLIKDSNEVLGRLNHVDDEDKGKKKARIEEDFP